MQNEDEQLIEINKNNILMEFRIDDQDYVVLGDQEEVNEGDLIYFAKIEVFADGNFIIRDIESDDEYNKVINYYDDIINEMGEDDEDND